MITLTLAAFWIQVVLNTVLITSLIGGFFKYPHLFHTYRRWLVFAFISLAILNNFALFVPSTPFLPWSYIASRAFLTALAVDVLGFVPYDLGVKIVQSLTRRRR